MGAAGKAEDPAQRAPLSDQMAVRLAELFQALSDATRVRIVALLLDAEMCVGEIAEQLGMSQSATSHQLRTLRDLQLVRTRRKGKRIFYTLDDDHVAELFQTGFDHVLHG